MNPLPDEMRAPASAERELDLSCWNLGLTNIVLYGAILFHGSGESKGKKSYMRNGTLVPSKVAVSVQMFAHLNVWR